MLFDKSEFLDLLPQKTMRQRLAESRSFRLLVELMLVCGMAGLLWVTLIRVHLPGEIEEAYSAYDQAISARDPLKALSMFPSDVTITIDGEKLSLGNFSSRTTALLRAKEIGSITQATKIQWARKTDDGLLEVKAIATRIVERPGLEPQKQRLGLTMMWSLTAAGWRLKSMTCKSLRPRL